MIGLGPALSRPNIFDIAYENKQIASPVFAIQLGRREERE